MAVDWQAAWEELSAHVAGRPHHGSRDLALAMLEIQARNSFVEEHLPHTMRLYGVMMQEDLRAAARQEPVNRQDNSFDSDGGSSSVVAMSAPALRTTKENDGHAAEGSRRAS